LSEPVLLAIYLTSAILLSWGFHLAVEKPFMNASRKVGKENLVTVS
jgi:hypothetical protein